MISQFNCVVLFFRRVQLCPKISGVAACVPSKLRATAQDRVHAQHNVSQAAG